MDITSEQIQKMERRIVDLSYKHKLSHIGSCLCTLPILNHIYSHGLSSKVVLSCGHAGLALYVALEHFFDVDAENLLQKNGVHPDRSTSSLIECSTGSLGQGLPIALGMAFANRRSDVFCIISDGEAAEGSIYEALCIREKYRVNNLIVYCTFNGFSAYDETIKSRLSILPGLRVIDTSHHWFVKKYGQEAHYKVLTQPDYEKIICGPLA